ncbi:pyridoxamine 5'-phosphate oxidase family protein [soil metagenome]
MTETQAPVVVLSEAESWALLGEGRFGHLALSIAGEPEIFPVNYFASNGSIVFRTAEGTKLFGAVLQNVVAFEVDSYDDQEGWSVVAKGTAHILETDAERSAAEQLPLAPWIPTDKRNFVRIDVREISGRHFRFGPEPDLY